MVSKNLIQFENTGLLRLVGLVGLTFSVLVLALVERSASREILLSVSAGAALLFAAIYFLGVMVVADSGASRILPRFP